MLYRRPRLYDAAQRELNHHIRRITLTMDFRVGTYEKDLRSCSNVHGDYDCVGRRYRKQT